MSLIAKRNGSVCALYLIYICYHEMARLVDLKILDLRRRLDVFELEVDIGLYVRSKGVDIIQSGLGDILVGNADIDLTDVAGYTVVGIIFEGHSLGFAERFGQGLTHSDGRATSLRTLHILLYRLLLLSILLHLSRLRRIDGSGGFLDGVGHLKRVSILLRLLCLVAASAQSDDA